MDSANDQKSRDFERRFLPSVGLGFSGFIISLVLILVAHRLLVRLWKFRVDYLHLHDKI